MIKKFYSKRASKPGWKWDAAKGQFWSWGYDERIDGRRVREAGFSSDDQVKVVVGKLKEKELLAKHGLITRAGESLVTVPQLVEARAQAFDFNNAQHRQRYSVLKAFRDRLSPLTQVRQLTTEDISAYVSMRQEKAGLKASTIQRELNEIRAMLHASGEYFPALMNWKPPRLPHVDKPRAEKNTGGRPRKLLPEQLPEVLAMYEAYVPRLREAKRILKTAGAEAAQRAFPEFSQRVIEELHGGQPGQVGFLHVGEHYGVSADLIELRVGEVKAKKWG